LVGFFDGMPPGETCKQKCVKAAEYIKTNPVGKSHNKAESRSFWMRKVKVVRGDKAQKVCWQTNVCVTHIPTRTHNQDTHTHTHTHIQAEQCKRRQINYQSLLSKQADILCAPCAVSLSLSPSSFFPFLSVRLKACLASMHQMP